MADRPASERTEAPTPERLRKAREEGRVAQSQELPHALMIGLLLVVFGLSGSYLFNWFSREMTQGLSFNMHISLDADGFSHLLQSKATACMLAIAPFVAVGAAVSIFSGVLVGGWTYAPKALKFDWSRMSLSNGMQGLFSTKSLATLLASVLKLTLLSVIVYVYLRDRMREFEVLQWTDADGMLTNIASLAFGVTVRIAVGICAIAGLDWLYQRWQFTKQLRMTKDEVKQERKEYELSPQIRSRMRSIQFEMARRRAMKDVPTADVVIVNPTHVAVAIKYNSGVTAAPVVVAKGPDLLCQQIKDIARKHDVPIVERPELARALYAAADIGEQIPETLFVAVAEVLAMVYRTRKKSISVKA